MNERVSYNLQILSPEKSEFSAVSAAALYGRGVFTSLAFFEGAPFLWEKHWRRLSQSAEKLGIDLIDYPEPAVKKALAEIIRENNLSDGRARLTLFDASPGKIWNFAVRERTSFLITTAPFADLKQELLLNVSPFTVNSRSPLAGIKSCNYTENLLALEEARAGGFDETVRLNERGEIASAATANIFWVKASEIFTPALETGCLAGTTREFLLENFPVLETRSGVAELFEADEIFLTSAGIGVRAARFESTGRKKSGIAAKLSKHLDLHKVKT